MTFDEQAQAIVVAWMDRCLPLQELLANPHHAWLIQSLALDIAAALRQQWEEAAKICDWEPDRIAMYLANALRQRAKGEA